MPAIGLIFLVAGVGLAVGCIFSVTRTRRFLSRAREARAEVVRMNKRLGDNHQPVYYPVLSYRTQEGSTREVVSSVGSNPPRYKEGDSVVVLYDPAKPDDMKIHNFFNVWLWPMVLGGIGAIFLAVGAGMTFLTER